MRLQIITDIESIGVIERLLSIIFRKNILIEGREGKVVGKIIPLNQETRKTITVMTELAYQGYSKHRITNKEPIVVNLEKGVQKISWLTYLPSSGRVEARIYVKELTDRDELLNGFLIDRRWKAPDNVNDDFPMGTRYQIGDIKIYSLGEVALFILTIISAIGAFFEVLNFLFK